VHDTLGPAALRRHGAVAQASSAEAAGARHAW
jgi:hypothetical protein